MQKRIFPRLALFTLASLALANAYAIAPGFYMGLQVGPATNNGGTQQAQVLNSATTVQASPRSTQFGSGLYMGYKVNQYVGSEGGFSYFSGINYDTKGVQACSSVNTRVRDLYFVGKGSVPVGSFEAIGKAGVAVVYQTTGGALNPDLTQECGETNNSNKFVPTVSIGVSYDLSQSWTMDATWTRIMAGGAASTVDWYAMSIAYHFVSVYCGQFLCN